MKVEFLEKEFEIKDYYAYLRKESVQIPKKIKIVDVMETSKPNRPVFLGEFPDGTKYKFDFCVDVLKEFIGEYGKLPKDWVGCEFNIKAMPIRINKRDSLRLTFKPL